MADNFSFRTASTQDAFEIMRVYQLDHQTPADDGDFTRLPVLTAKLCASESMWIVLESASRVEGFAWLLIDREQKLAKINRAYVNPALPGGREAAVEELVAHIIEVLGNDGGGVEVLYTSLRPLAYSYDIISNRGFKILGIFPNGKVVDNSVVNSLAAYYFHDVLNSRRQAQVTLHPLLVPLYSIASLECGLGALPVTEAPQSNEAIVPDALPVLEVITAPNFVSQRFARLKSRQFLSMQFYPFHEPNTLITDPNQAIEIFIKIFPEGGMATVIGERLDLDVDPVSLYKRIADLLNARGITYIEVINDAGDVQGSDAIIKAGYLPCAYFPALKRQGESRRDYVVFARSFENFCYPNLEKIGQVHVDYLKQYYQLEVRAYHHYMNEAVR